MSWREPGRYMAHIYGTILSHYLFGYCFDNIKLHGNMKWLKTSKWFVRETTSLLQKRKQSHWNSGFCHFANFVCVHNNSFHLSLIKSCLIDKTSKMIFGVFFIAIFMILLISVYIVSFGPSLVYLIDLHIDRYDTGTSFFGM